MTTLINDCHAGVNGTDVGDDNGAASGGAFAFAFGFTYDNSHTTMAMMSSATSGLLGWNLGSSIYTTIRAVDLYLTAYPDADMQLMMYITDGGAAVSVGITSAGHVALYHDMPGTAIATMTGTVPLNQWCKVQIQLDLHLAGSYTVDLYAHRTDSSPAETLHDGSWTGPNSPCAQFIYGQDTTSATCTYWLGTVSLTDGLTVAVPVLAANLATPAPVVPLVIPPPARLALHPLIPIEAPPVRLALTVFAPSLADLTLSPDDGAYIPSTSPAFSLTLLMPGDLTSVLLQVEYDTDPAFGTPTDITAAPEDGRGATPTILRPATPLSNGDYYWRARVFDGSVWDAWRPTRLLTIDTTLGAAAAAGSWTATAGTPDPYLWFAFPPAGEVGDQITGFGQGLGLDGGGTATVSGIDTPVTSFTHVAAGSDAYNSARTIDPVSGTVTVEHDEATFTIPDVDAPGGPLYFTAS